MTEVGNGLSFLSQPIPHGGCHNGEYTCMLDAPYLRTWSQGNMKHHHTNQVVPLIFSTLTGSGSPGSQAEKSFPSTDTHYLTGDSWDWTCNHLLMKNMLITKPQPLQLQLCFTTNPVTLILRFFVLNLFDKGSDCIIEPPPNSCHFHLADQVELPIMIINIQIDCGHPGCNLLTYSDVNTNFFQVWPETAKGREILESEFQGSGALYLKRIGLSVFKWRQAALWADVTGVQLYKTWSVIMVFELTLFLNNEVTDFIILGKITKDSNSLQNLIHIITL